MDGFPRRAPESLSPELVNSLRVIAKFAPGPCDDWVIIGSTAALLLGADVEPEDVDVLASRFTIKAFLEAMRLPERNLPGHPNFRSVISNRAKVKDGLPIDFLGDMMIKHENSRTPLQAKTRIGVMGPFGEVFVPSAEEQISFLRRFGRAKDLARIPKLQTLLDAES